MLINNYNKNNIIQRKKKQNKTYSKKYYYIFPVAIDLIVHHISEILRPGESAANFDQMPIKRRDREH